MQPGGTSQSIALEQLVLRQQKQDILWVCLQAGAGYGKSFLLVAFLELEEAAGRQWAVIAPSGVAANNIGGTTIHFFFLMRADYTSAMEPETEASVRLETTPGLLKSLSCLVKASSLHVSVRNCL